MWPKCTLATVLSLILAAGCASILAQEEKACEPAKASISGKVFYQFGYPPSPDAPVYLFTLEQTKALRALEEAVDKRVKDPHLTQNYASFLESEYTEQRVILIENLPREALTKTNGRGVFKVTNVVPGRRYHLVALKVSEDGVRLAMGITPKLQPGQELKFDLSSGVPWAEQIGIK